MSVIWDQLNNSEGAVRLQAEREEVVPLLSSMADRRTSGRADTYVPLFVYGYTSSEEPFHEETHTLDVSTNGGLLRIDAPVRRGQKLLLLNRVSNQELECTVVRVVKQPKRTFAGVAFAHSAPGFWKCAK
jgi:hypothetical protein